MHLNIGQKIRELRCCGNRTQEDVAKALGVTSQAVSRWESGGSYPDMEIIPSVANYFGVSIDELFGYENSREKKIADIIAAVEGFDIRHNDDIGNIEKCISILRDGLAEFPGNEHLMITLADTLWEAGWLNHREWLSYDEDGFIAYRCDTDKKNAEWSECAKICESLVESTKNNCIFTRAISILVPLYRNYGEFEKAISHAKRMPKLQQSREFLLTEATDGKLQAKYVGKFLLESARQFSEQLVFGLIANIKNFDTDMPIEKVKGAISIFDLICDDGNMGIHHDFVSKLYLYLSRLQWEKGNHDDAFVSLDKALKHAKAYEAICDENEHTFSAPLVSSVKFNTDTRKDVVKSLPNDWPFWCNPDYKQVEKEIKADPRWNKWVERTQNEGFLREEAVSEC